MVKVEGCNAGISIKQAFYPPGANFNGIPSWIELQVLVDDWPSAITLEVSGKELNARSIDKKCSLLTFKNKKARDSFSSALISDLGSGLQNGTIGRGYYFDSAGANTLADGSVCFLCGSELIGSCNRPYLVAPEYRGMRLLGEARTPTEVLPMLLASPPPVLLTFAYVLLTSVRSVLIDNKVDLQAVLYIVGKQGLGKTTLATRIAGIYEQDERRVGIVQAGSTLSAVNAVMVSLRDQPLIVDDLCLSASRKTTQKRIELVSQLIRQASGGIPIIKRNGKATEQLPCGAGVILTAEFALDNLSDLTRCLIVPVKKQMDIPEGLGSDMIGTAVRHYLPWFSTRSHEEIERFRAEIAEHDSSKLDVRIRTNYACLESAFRSFLRSMQHTDYSKRLSKKMREAINLAVAEHMALIEKVKSAIPLGNLAHCLLTGYDDKEFDLAKKVEKLHKHDGIIWKGDLCLKQNALIQFVRHQPGYQNSSSRRIVQELKDIGALVIQEESAATVHIIKEAPRVYRIRLKALQNAAERY